MICNKNTEMNPETRNSKHSKAVRGFKAHAFCMKGDVFQEQQTSD